MEQGNIIGEEFREYVFDQIKIRQSLNGAGKNQIKRNHQTLNYLNNRNAWVKMASGVSLIDPNKLTPVAAPSRAQIITNTTNPSLKTTGLDRLRSISQDLGDTTSNLDYQKYNGTGLAKNFVLFNTLSNFGFEGENIPEKLPYIFRSGIQTSQKNWLDVDSSYGLGGTAMGLQPTPGIIDVSIDCVNRGSIRKATVTLKAYNRFQFSIIEMLYLRLGYTMMLEWGWDSFITEIKEDGTFETESMGTTIIEEKWFKNQDPTNPSVILDLIEEKREEYQGNYDGFFGKVNNFNWTFNNDGSYDITIDLITVGDVVESLKVNIDSPIISQENLKSKQKALTSSPKNEDISEDSALYNALGGDVLSQYLSSLIINYGQKNSPLIRFSDITKNNYGKNILQNLEYFITLGSFLDKVQELVINNYGGGEKIINIDTNREQNYISCFYNQIPFDPKVCIFTTKYSKKFIETYKELNNAKGFPTTFMDSNLWRKFMVEREGFVAGKLMNVWLNVDFLLKILKSNLNEKGDLSLFQLIDSICKGLNNALGNVNNLEPVIKDDNTLVIIDQNPIPQIKKFTNVSTPKVTDTTLKTPTLEVLGYNNDQSNFVKNIKFQTKIDNSLASMISIGATAGGSSTKNSDATAFSKWNIGLKDRFTPPQKTPNPKNMTLMGVDIDEHVKSSIKEVRGRVTKTDRKGRGFVPSFNIPRTDFLPTTRKNLSYPISLYPTEQDALNAWGEKVRKYKISQDKNLYEKEELDRISQNTYAIVLCNVFGRSVTIKYKGRIKTFNSAESNYSDLFNNDDLVNKLKSSFKSYINLKANSKFETDSDASGNIGFIPLSFDITLEGISGVKIYNKLNIDTRFLPPNYNEALDFLIIKNNHKISNNNWDTTLGTISTSNLKDNTEDTPSLAINSPEEKAVNNYEWLTECPVQYTRELGGIRVTNGRLEDNFLKEINNPQTYKGNIQSDKGRIRLYNPVTDKLNQFLTFASSQGIILKINSAYRTYDDQLRVINEYGKSVAACPGTSNHGFGLAVDLANKNGKRIKPGMKEYEWVKKNAPDFGFNRLPWGNKGENWESWHWEYTEISRNLSSILKEEKSAFIEKKNQNIFTNSYRSLT